MYFHLQSQLELLALPHRHAQMLWRRALRHQLRLGDSLSGENCNAIAKETSCLPANQRADYISHCESALRAGRLHGYLVLGGGECALL